jgi:hypothetical protein
MVGVPDGIESHGNHVLDGIESQIDCTLSYCQDSSEE